MRESPLIKEIFNMTNRTEVIKKSQIKGIKLVDIKKGEDPDFWIMMRLLIESGINPFPPNREQKIPKGEKDEFGNEKYRVVKIGCTEERMLMPLINNALFKLFPHYIHPQSKAYQIGMSCGKVVQEASNEILAYCLTSPRQIIGCKYDFSKFFDTVWKSVIFELFDRLEYEMGFEPYTEPVLNLLRAMFNSDLIIDTEGNLVEKWSGIRQGNAVSAFLANAVMYELDEYMSNKYSYYCRYSDDLIVLGSDVNKITDDINSIICKYGVKLNPNKVQPLKRMEFFKFLGFAIQQDNISISESRLKKLRENIYKETIFKKCTKAQAIRNVNRALYKGNGEYSWATAILSVINCEEDIDTINKFIMDCIRCCEIGRYKRNDVGGIGYYKSKHGYVILREKGKAVRTARQRTEKWIDEYYSLRYMRNLMITDKMMYTIKIRNL